MGETMTTDIFTKAGQYDIFWNDILITAYSDPFQYKAEQSLIW